MKTFKQLLRVAAVAAIVCGASGLRADTETVNGITWRYMVDNGNAKIVGNEGYSYNMSGDIIIPSTFGGYPVTSIGDFAFFSCYRMDSITIPDGVTSIGNNVFVSCESLTSITIPDSVTRIGNYAFSSCESLTSITIPDSVTSIGEWAFSGCKSLTSITIPDSVTSIGNYAFARCSSLRSVTMPGSIKGMGYDVFYECSSSLKIEKTFAWKYVIKDGGAVIINADNPSISVIPTTTANEIKIPDTLGGCPVTAIGDNAFLGCYGITSVIIPSSVKTIGANAFKGCKKIISITLPKGVDSIGDGAFSGCTGLLSITIPDSIASIGKEAFASCSKLTSLSIPKSAKIGENAFKDCSSLSLMYECDVNGISWSYRLVNGKAIICINYQKDRYSACSPMPEDGNVTIPDTVDGYPVVSIDQAFVTTDVKSIVIPNGVTSIGNWAFRYNTELTSITIPDSVTSIGEQAFLSSGTLTSITIPDSVKSIGSLAFQSCRSLEKIVIPNGDVSIADDAFLYCDNVSEIKFSNGEAPDGNDILLRAQKNKKKGYFNFYGYHAAMSSLDILILNQRYELDEKVTRTSDDKYKYIRIPIFSFIEIAGCSPDKAGVAGALKDLIGIGIPAYENQDSDYTNLRKETVILTNEEVIIRVAK